MYWYRLKIKWDLIKTLTEHFSYAYNGEFACSVNKGEAIPVTDHGGL
jgi:hypothetical protein